MEFHRLRQEYTDHPYIHLILHHQEELAHLIYAASDMFIVPSIFEPCGLTQMIALKYGTIPIVRKTGGLADTVFDVDHSDAPPEKKNGYTFDYPDAKGIDSALDRAIACWFNEPEKWRKLVLNGMKIDFSWNEPSNKYVEIYKKLCK
jgi:starch synthase